MSSKILFETQLFMLKIFGMQLNYNTTGWKGKFSMTWGLLFLINFMFDFMMKTHYLIFNVGHFIRFLEGIPMWTSSANTIVRMYSFYLSRKLINDFLEDVKEITNKG